MLEWPMVTKVSTLKSTIALQRETTSQLEIALSSLKFNLTYESLGSDSQEGSSDIEKEDL